jgi:glutamate N-acetyltransferase / amino-acid N-acetyltransferase
MRSPSSFDEISGNINAPKGFQSSGVAAHIKKSGNKDLALIFSEKPCHVAGTFTVNLLKAAPVVFDLQRIRKGGILGVVFNSGNANACTGAQGLQNTATMSQWATEATTHGRSKRKDFLVCSTGRIGIQLPMDKVHHGIKEAARTLSQKGTSAAEAIMTTDTFAKQIAVRIRLGGKEVRIGGIAKGAGMIQPGMSAKGKFPALHATMLCAITTDAVLSQPVLQDCLNRAVAQSFNRITVDGDMSTNDTVLLLANGQAHHRPIKRGSRDLQRFQEALNHVALNLALMIVKDGEGISKVVTLEVKGAATAAEAENAIRAIGNSTLVKCSWCGEDPNWGRIWDAIGYSGTRFNSSTFSIEYNGILLVKNGLQMSTNLKKVHKIIRRPSFSIACDLGLGKHRAILYTTDLTEKYVELNKGE